MKACFTEWGYGDECLLIALASKLASGGLTLNKPRDTAGIGDWLGGLFIRPNEAHLSA